MLTINNLNVNYGGIHALKGISLEVPQNKIVTLIGANGAGKSSTLKSIMGLAKASSGSIRFSGEEITNKPTTQIVSKGIVLVPEGRRIFSNLTVEENLMLGAFARNDKEEIRGTWIGFMSFSQGLRKDFGRKAGLCQAASSRCWQWQEA
jgi:branched-chain amino acid transport system ATP-binding protein